MPFYDPSFLHRPKDVGEAVGFLREYGPSARLVAGNTTIYELSRQGALSDVEHLVDVMQLGLSYIREDDGGLATGATTTFSDLQRSALLDKGTWLALKETARKITPPQVRNMGTIGGSLSSGIPFYDMPTCVMAMGAEVKVVSTEGERSIGIDEFFLDYFVTALAPEELLTELQLKLRPNTGTSFVKLGRLSVDFAVVNCATSVTLDEGRRKVKGARIALGAVSNTPIRSKGAEESLEGRGVSMEAVTEAAKVASDFEPSSSVHASSGYKKRVIPVLVRDSLISSIERAGGRLNRV